MHLHVPLPVLLATKHGDLDLNRRHPPANASRTDLETEVEVTFDRLSREAIEDLDRVAEQMGALRFRKVTQGILNGFQASAWKVTGLMAFPLVLADWMKAHCPDGWIWHKGEDGVSLPYALSKIDVETGQRNRGKPAVTLWGTYLGYEQEGEPRLAQRLQSRKWVFEAGDVTNRRMETVLAARDLSAGSETLQTGWAERMEKFDTILATGFARQFRVTGAVRHRGLRRGDRDPLLLVGRRVLSDTEAVPLESLKREITSAVFGRRGDPELVPLPRHPTVIVVDLTTLDRFEVSTDHLEPHAYDPGLRDRLILPPAHRDMLDVLTTDIEALSQDIVEGKAAGNIILAKGLPGTGKTLTAEIYAEIMERPLVRVQAATLGTTPETVSRNLSEVFQKARRWGSAILIDEADVFVMRRGDRIDQNAITAEFLRALEYYPGLVFMTTNRPDDIDEAVLSRCVAIFHFKPPSPAAARKIWATMAETFETQLPAELIEDMVTSYPAATGRDIKLMLRSALRYAAAKGIPIDSAVMRRIAMTRGMIPDEPDAEI